MIQNDDEKGIQIIFFVGNLHADAGCSGFPHHHHSEIFCLSTDLVAHEATATCSRHMHHSDDADRHSCTSVCVTNFQCSTPDQHLSDITPDYSFYSILYPLVNVLGVLALPTDDADADWALFVESLHAYQFIQTAGLRAPPASVILV